MVIDAQCMLSDGQAITTATTTVSQNTYDSGLATNDIPTGEPLAVVISIDVAADLASGNETYQWQVIQSAAADLGSPDVLVESDTTFVSKAVLVAGYQLVLPIPPHLKTKRYLGVQLISGGTSPSVTWTAWLTPLSFVQADKIYPKNYKITS